MNAQQKQAPKSEPIRPFPFGETTGTDVYNASDVVEIADSRFLFCDNNTNDALLELVLTPEGTMACPLVRRPLVGLADGAVDDMEGMALVEHAGRKLIFITPSFSLKQRKGAASLKRSKRGKEAPARNGLIRVTIEEGDRLEAELIPDFKGWLLAQGDDIGKAARRLPDDGGLNVEGMGWDPDRQALLFGVRTPVPKAGPMILRVRIKDLDGPWDVGNLERLPPVLLKVGPGQERGIRSIVYDPTIGASLVVVGNSTSSSKAPFELYAWDGNEAGSMGRFPHVRFAKGMKPEGVARGTIGGRGAIVFVDDSGGYQVLWEGDPRLQQGLA